MKIRVDDESELIIMAQKVTGITDLKELIEKALQLLIKANTPNSTK